MLSAALAFFIAAIMAAVFAFTGLAGAAAGVAQLLFFLFAALFVVALTGDLARKS